MAQQYRLGTHKTYIRTQNRTTKVRYHYTDVVSFSPSLITLNTGGWFTNTTKTRMNQASRQYNLGYRVQQIRGRWIVHYRGRKIPFTGNSVTFRR